MNTAPWAIISKHGVVHRTDAAFCLAITDAQCRRGLVKMVTPKQVQVYKLPACHDCFRTPQEFAEALRERFLA